MCSSRNFYLQPFFTPSLHPPRVSKTRILFLDILPSMLYTIQFFCEFWKFWVIFINFFLFRNFILMKTLEDPFHQSFANFLNILIRAFKILKFLNWIQTFLKKTQNLQNSLNILWNERNFGTWCKKKNLGSPGCLVWSTHKWKSISFKGVSKT